MYKRQTPTSVKCNRFDDDMMSILLNQFDRMNCKSDEQKSEIKEIKSSFDEKFKEQNTKFDTLSGDINNRFNEQNKKFDDKLNEINVKLIQQLDKLGRNIENNEVSRGENSNVIVEKVVLERKVVNTESNKEDFVEVEFGNEVLLASVNESKRECAEMLGAQRANFSCSIEMCIRDREVTLCLIIMVQ